MFEFILILYEVQSYDYFCVKSITRTFLFMYEELILHESSHNFALRVKMKKFFAASLIVLLQIEQVPAL
jgi:hypothetical protein